MLLSEQVRNLENEENLFGDIDNYTRATECDWNSQVTKNITLSAESLVLVRWTTEWHMDASGNASEGGSRVLLDDVPVVGTGNRVGTEDNAWESAETEAYLKLSSGSYTFDFEISMSLEDAGSNGIRITDIYIGVIDFNDLDVTDGDSDSTEVADEATVEVISKTFTTPASRTTPIGDTNKCNMLVFVNMFVEDEALSVLKDSGDSDTSGRMNWKIFRDATQVSWRENHDDYQTDNASYCEGAYGIYSLPLNANTEYTIAVKATNKIGSTKNVRAYISIIYSPWILTSVRCEPVTFDFPQGSTLYVTLEPLSRNPTKEIRIGKNRAAQFGASFYDTSSGVDIIEYDYTFEIVQVTKAIMDVNGLGGCISIIAVDVR